MSAARIDQLLAKARLRERPYGREEIAVAERRLAARIAHRMPHGSLSFDDPVQPTAGEPYLPRPWQCCGRKPNERRSQLAFTELRGFCQGLVGQADALHRLSSFISNRVLEPAGAVVLGCVLQLSGRDDSARFWWQFAAGAGCYPAMHCLYLHHLSLGEAQEADWWTTLMEQVRADGPDPIGPNSEGRRLMEAEPRSTTLPRATEAIVGYVLTAIEYVDEVELPLPTPGFARRIEELTATA